MTQRRATTDTSLWLLVSWTRITGPGTYRLALGPFPSAPSRQKHADGWRQYACVAECVGRPMRADRYSERDYGG